MPTAKPTPADSEKLVTTYAPLTPAEAAAELGVQLTQRNQPNLRDAVPSRFVPKAEAEARGWSWYFTGSDVCRYGHNAARRTSNDQVCSDCQRVKGGEGAPIYGRSKAQRHYPEPRRKPVDSAASVVVAPATPAPLKPDKREQEFLAKFAELRNVERAAEATGFTIGQIESRRSSDPTFNTAVQDLTSRLDIPWTRAPDASGFAWTSELERTFANRYVDCGLLIQVREEMGVPASAYHERLQRSPTFAELMSAATPLARSTLRDRATQAAAVGKVDLLKFLEKDEEESSLASMTAAEINHEIRQLISGFDRQNLIPHPTRYLRKSTGELIDASDLECIETTHTRSDNSDLVSA